MPNELWPSCSESACKPGPRPVNCASEAAAIQRDEDRLARELCRTRNSAGSPRRRSGSAHARGEASAGPARGPPRRPGGPNRGIRPKVESKAGEQGGRANAAGSAAQPDQSQIDADDAKNQADALSKAQADAQGSPSLTATMRDAKTPRRQPPRRSAVGPSVRQPKVESDAADTIRVAQSRQRPARQGLRNSNTIFRNWPPSKSASAKGAPRRPSTAIRPLRRTQLEKLWRASKRNCAKTEEIARRLSRLRQGSAPRGTASSGPPHAAGQ